jgi:PAS domain S-box-containing protein
LIDVDVGLINTTRMKIYQAHNSKLIANRRKSKTSKNTGRQGVMNIKNSKPSASDHLHHLAFDNSLLANIISIVSSGKIIAANRSAGKLLGYSNKNLLTKNMRDIFTNSDNNFEQILEHSSTAGHAVGDIAVIKKDGKQLPCQITSVVFTGDNHIKKAITTLVDLSEGIRRQKNIDLKKDARVAAEMSFAELRSDATLIRLDDLEHKLNIEITAKEQIQSSSLLQQIFFEREWEEEGRLKEKQIAEAITEAKELERSDLGKELHDNVNQLLVASRLYLDIARKDKAHREMYLSRSSEYTLSAIEEIRKLTKGLITGAIMNLGLCDAIHNITQDIMEVYPIKISCKMDNKIQPRVSAKFNLNIFRIVQEQLNNIIKHAKASVVNIGLSQKKIAIILTISDNGSGFDVAKKRKGIGMANIKSRAEFFKGRAEFVSQPGNGCVLTVTFPAGDSPGNGKSI